jgi:hypothetical protein
MQTINLTFTVDQVNTILAALQELPYKTSGVVIQSILDQHAKLTAQNAVNVQESPSACPIN